MHIDFGSGLEGFQNARRLKLILDYYRSAHGAGYPEDAFLAALERKIEEYLARPEFESLRNPETSAPFPEIAETNRWLAWFGDLWRALVGPSRRELELGRQRSQLLERAEHAELMAFEALAETADIGRERNELLAKLKTAERELEALKRGVK
jgi:hypothetical protein